jgi:hypothetical protein
MSFGQSLVAAFLVLAATAGGGCGAKLPQPASPTSCGDQCATMSCPPGSTCTLSSSCTPRCEQQPLPNR